MVTGACSTKLSPVHGVRAALSMLLLLIVEGFSTYLVLG
jgi:hypothetical protein